MNHTNNPRRYFDALAPGYDERTAAAGWQNNTVFGKKLGALTCNPQAYLDLGAGTGETITETLRHTRPERIVAVEFAPQMVALLRRKFRGDARFTYKTTTINDYLAGDANEGPFGLVTAICVYSFVAEPRQILEGVARNLTEDGLFIFTYEPAVRGEPTQTPFRHAVTGQEITTYRQSRAEIARMARQSGLSIVSDERYSALKERDVPARIVVARQ